jgi:O-antigen/teichoic acid export membrane protein
MSAANSAALNTVPELPGKRMIKRSFLLILGKILRLGIQLAVVIIYAHKLLYADYGTYQSVWLYINILSVIALFGLPSLLLSSNYSHIKNWVIQNKKSALSAFIILSVLPAIAFFFIIDTFSFQLKILILLLTIVQNISILSEIMALKKEADKKVFASNIFFSIAFLVAHLWILYYGYSLQLLLISLILTFCIKSIITSTDPEKNNRTNAENGFAPLGKQWFYLGVNDIAGVLANWLDKWVILLFVSVTQFAIYFNGAYEVPVFGLMLGAVGNIMLIEFSKKDGNDLEKIKLLFEKSSLLLASIVFPAFCFLLFYHSDFFLLIFSQKYIDSIPVFFVSIFILPLRITYTTTVLQVYHRSDLIVKGAVMDIILAVILMLILYPVFKMPGLALAFVLSSYFQFTYYLWHTSRLINKKISYFFPFKRLLIKMFLCLLVMTAGYFVFKNLPVNSSLLSGIVLAAILVATLLLYYYKKENKAENL